MLRVVRLCLGGRDRDVVLRVQQTMLPEPFHRDQRIPHPEGEVDRLVREASLDEPLEPTDNPFDAVIDVGEVEDLLVSAEDGNRVAAADRVDDSSRSDPTSR